MFQDNWCFSECPSGNCPGCKNDVLNCQDKACAPYCRGCQPFDSQGTANLSSFIFIIIILLLVAVFLQFHPYFRM